MEVDRNGQSEIVCAFETEESMRKMIQVFKSHNPAWISSRVLISDKDCSERAVFAKEFPGISLQLCLFQEVLDEKLLVTRWESELEKEIMHWSPL